VLPPELAQLPHHPFLLAAHAFPEQLVRGAFGTQIIPQRACRARQRIHRGFHAPVRRDTVFAAPDARREQTSARLATAACCGDETGDTKNKGHKVSDGLCGEHELRGAGDLGGCMPSGEGKDAVDSSEKDARCRNEDRRGPHTTSR